MTKTATSTTESLMAVGPGGLLEIMAACHGADVPLLVYGPPGIGKTALAFRYAASCGLPLRSLSLPGRDVPDLYGLPVTSFGRTSFAAPLELPIEQEDAACVLLLDEIGQAETLMQAAAMQLIHERRVGPHRLPAGTWVLGCTNRAEDLAGANPILTPLAGRCVQVTMREDVTEWLAWAAAAAVDPAAVATVRTDPRLLCQWDPGEPACPMPRNWERLSRVALGSPSLPDGAMLAVAAGCVGLRAATSYMAARRMVSRIDPAAVMANPAGCTLPAESDLPTWHALVSALDYHISRTPATLPALGILLERVPGDYVVLLALAGLRAVPPADRARLLDTSGALGQWHLRHHQAIMAAKAQADRLRL